MIGGKENNASSFTAFQRLFKYYDLPKIDLQIAGQFKILYCLNYSLSLNKRLFIKHLQKHALH